MENGIKTIKPKNNIDFVRELKAIFSSDKKLTITIDKNKELAIMNISDSGTGGSIILEARKKSHFDMVTYYFKLQELGMNPLSNTSSEALTLRLCNREWGVQIKQK